MIQGDPGWEWTGWIGLDWTRNCGELILRVDLVLE